MNLFLILVIVVTCVIFGWPIWYLAALRKNKHALWFIAPPVLFISLFGATRIFESEGSVLWYQILKPLSYYWLIIGMALFVFTVLGFATQKIFKISRSIIFYAIVGITFLTSMASYVNGQYVFVKEITLPANHITRPYTFVHITDLHAGSTGIRHAEKVVDMIQELPAEFVVITGDFIDEFFVGPENIAPFSLIENPIYLITGNHEYDLPEGTLEKVLVGSPINLIDDTRVIEDELDIIGVNDLHAVDWVVSQVGGINPDRYTIILDHQPITEEVHRASDLGADLMLSGHTHNGQIWPMGWLVSLRYKYVSGLYEIGDMFLYVNQGTGTLGPKMRFGTRNEITLITLEPKPAQ